MLSTTSNLLSAGPPVRLARLRLEGWLSEHRPVSIPDYADRVFARTVQVRDAYADAEVAALLIDRRRFLIPLLAGLGGGAVCSYLVDALRLAWVFRRHELPAHELEPVVAPLVERLAPAAEAWSEPARSDLFYWAGRLGWADSTGFCEPDGLGSLCDLATSLRQCDYGETRIGRTQAALQAGLLRAVREEAEPGVTGMLLAGTLWVETAVVPPSEEQLEWLTDRLIMLQGADGGFPGASPHRASCVALVALSRTQAILSRDCNLG